MRSLRSSTLPHAALGLLVALSIGCAEDLQADDAETPPPPPTGVETRDDGSFAVLVDATDEAAWIGFRFDSGVIGDGDDWDLRFRRFSIALNGGASGPGVGLAVYAPGDTLADATRAPDGGWAVDAPDGDDDDAETDRVLDGWYDYDPATHVLTPKAGVWYVRDAVGDRYYAVVVEDYYDAAGTSGMVSIGFKPVDAPATPPPIEQVEPPEPDPQPEPDPDPDPPVGTPVDASDRMAWAWITIDPGGALVEGSADDWDLAFQRSVVKVNGGVSGPGYGGARLAPEGLAWDDIEAAPTTGYLVDREVPAPGPPGAGTVEANPAFAEWYDYDPSTHRLSPKDASYVVRTADGRYGRFRIAAYADGLYHLQFDLIPVAPEVIEITAAARDDWVAYDLALGVEATEGGPWDIALDGVRMRTNGGASGDGQGAAQAVDGDALDALAAVDDAAWAEDEMVPEPGPPGAGEFAGNPILSAWYDYDPMTHQVSPAARVFAVRLHDGGLARLRVTGYADGAITFEYQYAGAGRSTF